MHTYVSSYRWTKICWFLGLVSFVCFLNYGQFVNQFCVFVLIVSTSAINCLERLVPEMTCCVAFCNDSAYMLCLYTEPLHCDNAQCQYIMLCVCM